MRRLVLIVVGACLAPLGLFARSGPVEMPQTIGFLDHPAFSTDRDRRPPSTPYHPQPGDLIFSTSDGLIYRVGHVLAGAGQPNHSGFVFRRPDGRLAAAEAGPYDTPVTATIDLEQHLLTYEERGRAWIRPRCVPLTEEQSCRLTEFALKQEGKRFALVRLFGQITPFRSRGPVRTYWRGGPHGPDRVSYYCAEMVTESLVYAGLIDWDDARPCATYPTDLFHDESKNLFLSRHFKLGQHGWGVPSRWSSQPLPE